MKFSTNPVMSSEEWSEFYFFLYNPYEFYFLWLLLWLLYLLELPQKCWMGVLRLDLLSLFQSYSTEGGSLQSFTIKCDADSMCIHIENLVRPCHTFAFNHQAHFKNSKGEEITILFIKIFVISIFLHFWCFKSPPVIIFLCLKHFSNSWEQE